MIILLCVLSAVLTSVLGRLKHVGFVRSSALLTIVFCFFAHIFKLDDSACLAAFFGGSFVGMTAASRLSLISIIIASVLFGIVYENYILGASSLGGTLGFVALICTFTLYLSSKLVRRLWTVSKV